MVNEEPDTSNVEQAINRFVAVLSVSFRCGSPRTSLSCSMREIFATRCARVVLSNALKIQLSIGTLLMADSTPVGDLRITLPTAEDVRRNGESLVHALRARDPSSAAAALIDMGVIALTMPEESQFRRLSNSVDSIVGAGQMTALVELTRLAVEHAAYSEARLLLDRALSMRPRPADLHSLYSMSGACALNGGEMDAAGYWLLESVRVCQRSEASSLECQARGLNLLLAEMLLQRGERSVVADFLGRCKTVWPAKMWILDQWIEGIQGGKDVRLDQSSPLEEPAIRMAVLVSLGEFDEADEANESDAQQGPQQLKELYQNIAAATKGKFSADRN